MLRALPILVLSGVLVVSAGGCGGNGDDGEPSGGSRDGGIVEVVYDGDTLRLEDGREVRLLQIDAPEKPRECYSKESADALVDVAPRGTEIELERDPGLDDEDSYGRLLRYVFVDGENVNTQLVEAGAAAPYFYKNGRGRYADALLDAVDDAQHARRGMWGACPDAELNPGLGSVTGPA